MRTFLLSAWAGLILLLIPNLLFGQAPNLGTASSFALFTSNGAINNVGATVVLGDIGTDVGAFNGFPPGVIIGNTHVADPVSAQAALDVEIAWNQLSAVTCGTVLGPLMGNNQLLTPGVYCLGAASTLTGDLFLDGQADPSALFIFKIDGAFATSTFSNVFLINSASLCNVFWQINGAVDLGQNSNFQGTMVVTGAISLLNNATLNGRGLSRAGAIDLDMNMVTVAPGVVPTPSVITANGPTTFCVGDSVILSGNVGGMWVNGEFTESITVTTSGDYFVTNTNACGSVTSNHIIVTVNQLPVCNITGNTVICGGQSTEFCATPGAASYLWSTGAVTGCINVSLAGPYSVTITDINGCSSVCSEMVTVNPVPLCSITGDNIICQGESTQLCATPGAASYLWSTGENTNCITVSLAGNYSVTITDLNGCSSVCSEMVTVNPLPLCTITGNLTICPGGSTQLCATPGAASYLWSTGENTNCINVNMAGLYSVTITDINGCSSVCSEMVTVNPLPLCSITGGLTICQGGSTQLCAPPGAASYLWSTGENTNCINVNQAGLYSVTITDINGCSSVCSEMVTVNPLPLCSITGGLTICQGGSTQLCAPPGAASYLWSTGENTNCINVNQAGLYSVTITDINGCSSVCSETVTVNPLPLCSITGNLTICSGGSTQLCATPGAASYLWSTGENTNCITVSLAGNYSVTITDINGCSSECSEMVEVNPVPICTITGDNTICQGESTQLCVPPGAMSYLWSTGENTNCITVSLAGNYSVTITDINGCSSECSEMVEVNPVPICTITGDNTICQGESTQLCVPPGAMSYLWSTGENTNCITVSLAGNYSVTITDINGCSSVCSEMVTVNPLPLCSITGGLTICQGGSTQLCVPPGAASYMWSTGENTNCINVNQAGLYSVTITDINGCSSVCSEMVTVNPLPLCSITGGDLVCEGEPIQLCATPGAASYLWSTGAITNCIMVSLPGIYSVTLTDANGCTSVCMKTVIADTIPPVITCPIDLTIDCDEVMLPIHTGVPVVTDNCVLPPVVNFNDLVMLGTCPQEFTVTRTWTAMDAAGNTAVCVQTIIVEDNSVPVMVCPANMTVQCADQVPAVTIPSVVTTDNCDGSVTVTHEGDDITGIICESQFILTRTYRATDDCGNTAVCTQVITVFDNTPPAIVLTDPLLANGDTIYVQCLGQDPDWDLPVFNETSVTATDSCGGMVTLSFNQELENGGNCMEDGYINLYRLTWIAVDDCGNSDSVVVFLALIDTIAPVIFGVPQDTTVNCNDIPELPFQVFATDECLCACVVFSEETLLAPGCQNGQVIVRTWTAMDDCGNISTATQTITLIDEQGPTLVLFETEIAGTTDGAILQYNCNDGGIPAFFGSLNASSVLSLSSCGGSSILLFEIDTLISNDCEAFGFLEQRTYRWVFVDDCGNLSTMTVTAQLIDDEAPVFIGIQDTTCIGDALLNLVVANDNCGLASMQFLDFNIPNPCGTGMAVQRVYEAFDECGNVARDTAVLIPDDQTAPAIVFINPELTGMVLGETIFLDCAANNGQYTSFGTWDVSVEDSCAAGVVVGFTEVLVELGDCSVDNIVAVVELRWTATDVCGNFSGLVLTANIIDETSPVFVNFASEITIGCNEDTSEILALDNCGETAMVMSDSIVNGVCEFEYVVFRTVTATDVCGNSITQSQTIQVGNGSGPIIEGVEEEICDDLTIPDVTAFDACAGVFVEVAMTQDTLDGPCDGLVIQRTWTAVDSCGNVSVVHQTIILNDQAPPEISVPVPSIIHQYLGNIQNRVFSWQIDLIGQLDTLNANSVLVTDDCDENIQVEFTVSVSYAGDCTLFGYFERRVYTWVATDVCGNSDSLSFTVEIVDTTPPVFVSVPADLTIVCEELPPAHPVLAEDLAGPVTIVYSETIEPGDAPGEFIVTRRWLATDACGNVSEYIQRITWIPVTILDCDLIVPGGPVDCNSHDILITSTYTGPGTFVWEVVGENCFIQGGQGTETISIYVGWSSVKVILTVTDTFGCVSMCMTTIGCIFSTEASDFGSPPASADKGANSVSPAPANGSNSSSKGDLQKIHLWPNPATNDINLSFESSVEENIELSLINFLGQVVLRQRINAEKGFNISKMDASLIREGSYLMQVRTEREIHGKVVVIMRGE